MVIRLGGLMISAGDTLTRPMGQTTARWLVMDALDDEPATVAQTARLLGLARQSVQRVADLLARDGMVAYADNPGHKRAKLVKLTPRGRRILRQIQATQAAWAEDLGSQLGERSLDEANAALERALAAMGERRFEARQISAKPG